MSVRDAPFKIDEVVYGNIHQLCYVFNGLTVKKDKNFDCRLDFIMDNPVVTYEQISIFKGGEEYES